MPVAIEKCEFHIIKIEFYGFIMELGKFSINLKKIKAVLKWQRPNNIIELQLFLGFCNYYKRFIKHQLDKIELFTKFTKKDEPWIWG